MSQPRPTRPDASRWASAWVAALLVLSAAITTGYWADRGLGRGDTEAMESPLILSVARQLIVGPGELYGPFGGSNPLVLIHAPLYYRAAAMLAWPMARAGLDPVDAARVAGRLISAAGLAAAMAAAYRLGRLGGRPRRAGWWSALLFAASPILAGQPVAVRPDLAGVALQSWGVVLALRALADPGDRRGRRLEWASVLFGLAFCVKQHLVAAWAVAAGLAAWGWLRGRFGLGALAKAVVPGAATAGLIYAAESVVTGGRVWEAAFLVAARVGRVHPGGWDTVLILSNAIVNPSAGTVSLLAAAGFVAVGRRPGWARWIATGAGTIAIGLVLAAAVAHLVSGSARMGALTFLATGLAAALALPTAALALRSPSPSPSRGVDAALAALLAAELGAIAMLSYTSSGAWVNYGIPAAVLASAIAGRALARALDAGLPAAAAAPALVAAAVLLVANVIAVYEDRWRLQLTRAQVGVIRANLRRPDGSYFFVGRPGLNRLYGRLELVHDEWLYPVFESIGQAEPRSRWLRRELRSGPVSVIVNDSPRPVVGGTAIDPRRLGYRPDIKIEPEIYVWVR